MSQTVAVGAIIADRPPHKSRKAGEYSITVAWDKDESRWETRKYKGNELVFLAYGKDFNSAMWHTTLLGPQLDEAVDTQ
jgi:hypothetical protein